MKKQITRSTTDCKIAGVCGGLADYFDINPILFRIIFVATILCSGSGIVAYVLFWIFLPTESTIQNIDKDKN